MKTKISAEERKGRELMMENMREMGISSASELQDMMRDMFA